MQVPKFLLNLGDEIQYYIPDSWFNYLPTSMVTRTVLIGTTAGIIGYYIFRKKYKLPPGPFAWPLVGNLEFFTCKENLAFVFARYAKKYGPIFTVYFGMSPTVVVNDIDSINEVLIKKSHQFSDRISRYSFLTVVGDDLDIAFGRYGSGWKLRRKVAARAIRLFMVKDTFDQKLHGAINSTIEAMLKEKGPFNPQPYTFYTTLNILGGLIFGQRYKYTDPTYRFLLERLDDLNNNSVFFLEDIFPPARLFPGKSFRKVKQVINELKDFIIMNVEEHKKSYNPDNISDLTYSIIKARKEIEAEGEDSTATFTDINATMVIFDLFLAGNNTSRDTLYWAILFITAHPEVQKRMQEEVDAVVGKERSPSQADRINLPYCDAVLHEVMRLGTVAPLGLPHNTSCDATLGEYEIPKGTGVIINHLALHHNPDNWKDVKSFKPERFLDENGKMAPKPDNWLPFGAGRRVCAGETLARPELHLILAGLFHKLHFTLEPGVPVRFDGMADPQVYVPYPYKVTVTKRI